MFTDEHLTRRHQPPDVCADFGAALVEFNGEDDHVNPLVEYPPTQLRELVNSLKGVTSPRLRQRFRLRTHRDHQWSPSYLVESRGGARDHSPARRAAAAAKPNDVVVPTAYRGSGYPGCETAGPAPIGVHGQRLTWSCRA
jgi:hypothetical protein